MDSTLPRVQYGYLTQDFPPHRHRRWEAHVFTAGRGRLYQDGVAFEATAGSLTLSPAEAEHSLTVQEPLAFYYVQFDPDRESLGVLRRLGDRQRVTGTLRVEESLLSELSRLKDKLDSPVADRVASGAHGFRAWLYDLAAGRNESTPDGIDQVLIWLRQNLNQRLTLEELAHRAGMGLFTFCRRFKARTGLSPLAYVHRSKVEAAGFLLAGTGMSLDEVAEQLGFCDEFHFGKVFKKWRGVPPGRWRLSRSNSWL